MTTSETIQSILLTLKSDEPDFNVNSENFLADSSLDSFDLMQLVLQIESKFSIKIPPSLLLPESFVNVQAIQDLVEHITFP